MIEQIENRQYVFIFFVKSDAYILTVFIVVYIQVNSLIMCNTLANENKHSCLWHLIEQTPRYLHQMSINTRISSVNISLYIFVPVFWDTLPFAIRIIHCHLIKFIKDRHSVLANKETLVMRVWISDILQHTHTYTHIYIYMYIYISKGLCQRYPNECSTRTCTGDCYNCWKKSKLKSYVLEYGLFSTIIYMYIYMIGCRAVVRFKVVGVDVDVGVGMGVSGYRCMEHHIL